MNKPMKIMFADSFYTDFWIFETTDRDDLIATVTDLENQRPHEIDETKHRVIYDSQMQYDMTGREAEETVDEIIWNFDLYED